MYIKGKGNWLNHINNALKKYNNRVHGTTKMTPLKLIINQLDPPTFVNKPKQPKFQEGDFVRVPDKRTFYSKGYTTNWKRELFKIPASTKQTQ